MPQKDLDPDQMKQVFTNIILNAIQAMPNGGELRVKSYPVSGQNTIDIADTGDGIEKDKIKNIFDPFFTTKEKGAGLGLAITYKIVEEQGGTISVESEKGKGTLLRVQL